MTQNYVKQLISLSESLRESIDDQTNIIDVIMKASFGEEITLPFECSILSIDGLHAYELSIQPWEEGNPDPTVHFTVLEKQNDSQTTVVDETFPLSTFPDKFAEVFAGGFSISNAMYDLTDAMYLNMYISTICETFITTDILTSSQLSALAQSVTGGNMTTGVSQFYSNLLSQGDNITTASFLIYLQALYTGVKEGAQNNNLELDETVATVQTFVGTAVLQIVGTVISFIGIVLAKVTFGLSLLLTGIGSVISFITGQVIDTDFKLNLGCSNAYLDTPIFARSNDYLFAPSMYKTNNVSYLSLPGVDSYLWKNSDNTAFMNSFLSLDVDIYPFIAQDIQDEPDGRDVMYYSMFNSNTRYWGVYNRKFLTNDMNPDLIEKLNATKTSPIIQDVSRDGIAYKIACSILCYAYFYLNFSISQGEPGWEFYIQDTASGRVDNPKSLSDIRKNLVFYLNQIVAYNENKNAYVLGDNVQNLANTIAFMMSYNGDDDTLQVNGINYVFSTHTEGIMSMIAFDVSENDYTYYNITTIPVSRFASFPNYSSNALMNTAITIGLIGLTMVTAYAATSYVIKKIITKVQLNKYTNLQSLRESYINNPTSDAYNAYYRASRNYNFWGSILGYSGYDIVTGMRTSGSIMPSSLSNSELMSNINTILKLIK